MAKLQITIDAKDAERAIKALEKDFVGFEKHVKQAETSVGTFSTNTSRMLKGVGVAVAGAFAVDQMISFTKYALDIADRYTLIDAKVKLATESQEEYNRSYEDLYQLTKDTGTVLDVNVQGFSKLSFALRETPSNEVIDYLETVNKSLTVAGAGAAESSSFMLQWSQAMGSGVVAGDELRAMVESNSYFMGLLAEELDTTINGLKKMGSEGTLTTEKFTKAMKAVAQTVEDDFANIPVTIEKATQTLKTVWEGIVAGADQTSGASRTIADSILGIADVVEENKDEISGLFVGILDSVPTVITGVTSVGTSVLEWGTTVKGVIDDVESAGGPSAADWGILGAILLKGPKGLTGLLGGLYILNDALVSYDLNIGSLTSSWSEYDSAVGNLLDVFTGKRDWNTGELIGDFEELDKAIEEAFSDIDNPELALELDLTEAAAAMESMSDMQKTNAAEWVAEHEKATEKMINNMSKQVEKMNADIIASTKDFSAELRDLQREGMSDEDAWNDLNAQMDEYKRKAKEAGAAGDWAEQADYLERIKGLLRSMPDDVRETVSADDVARAKQIYEYQLRITRGGQNAYGDAAKPFQDARKEYMSLLRAQEAGYRTVISEEDVLAKKIAETKSVNDQILENKQKQADATDEEKTNLENTLAEYKKLASGADDATGDLVDTVVEVGGSWDNVGDTWSTVSSGIISDVKDISNELDTAISKMNKLNSGSSGGGGYDGARALGGPVSSGKSYLVGEKGPERFTPTVSGYITPNNKLNEGGSGASKIVDINLSIDGGTPVPLQGPQTSLDEIERQAAEQRRYAA